MQPPEPELQPSPRACNPHLEPVTLTQVNLLLSGQLNHKKKDYKFGFGLAIGTQ